MRGSGSFEGRRRRLLDPSGAARWMEHSRARSQREVPVAEDCTSTWRGVSKYRSGTPRPFPNELAPIRASRSALIQLGLVRATCIRMRPSGRSLDQQRYPSEGGRRFARTSSPTCSSDPGTRDARPASPPAPGPCPCRPHRAGGVRRDEPRCRAGLGEIRLWTESRRRMIACAPVSLAPRSPCRRRGALAGRRRASRTAWSHERSGSAFASASEYTARVLTPSERSGRATGKRSRRGWR